MPWLGDHNQLPTAQQAMTMSALTDVVHAAYHSLLDEPDETWDQMFELGLDQVLEDQGEREVILAVMAISVSLLRTFDSIIGPGAHKGCLEAIKETADEHAAGMN